ncbi:bumetanide-sensitive sodium-(potassium)-chloride cotransporter [Solenopsis invicta]|uniref:bumetanide-sensitive sodium-(potassium)-chloride cotransporter n=1 Tax=Solenopsis invicta TaxID=13686 RepID=UPI0005963403|nr:bumetanide-sensitive sodium-(potassium)-chloride cotransporter [Solenopsis invicta]XP_011171412.1 bumetanide-sensitive sodium-(potassium)-chloride cotransporter [Solenopsis invicta]XP_039306716.1 bumetanide-sensitive sodium-(potassium)-chloride cotransporter [Solenopsis invicta]XP_039306717.1 bumetanide-sensitive sodium-(potassium)-chloride cotransporter [Solenopsis invicta]
MALENGINGGDTDSESVELNPLRRTRFHVNRVDSLEGRASLLGEQETKKSSLRYMTREALPRLDNYRNIMSIQAAHRPSLDELHNPTLLNKRSGSHTLTVPQLKATAPGVKFGWIQGVLMRCLLNIWGVMLFLRLSWVVAQTGVGQAILLILTTTVVTTITSLSMSAISTNGLIKGGGTYYMISRSLGPEFGGSIGLIFSLANAVACSMYVVGFCESLVDCLRPFNACMVDCGIMDIRIIGCITIVVLLIIVIIGLEWEAKAQIFLLIILLLAIVDFMIGSFVGPKSDKERAQGFIGYNAALIKENLYPNYRYSEGVHHNFFSVLAIFFPAATGILAGANISGDLKDPQTAIPKGTLLAILLTSLSYLLMAIMIGGSVMRDATGNVTDLWTTYNNSLSALSFLDIDNATMIENNTIIENINRTWSVYGTDFNCTAGCKYGSHNSFEVIQLVSGFGPIIYAGCFAATISSALASLVSAPKVFQALCLDKLYPGIAWFSGEKDKEPIRGYLLTFIIAVAFILIGELNAIAPLISNFFLAAYTLINFSTFHASLAKPIGWRPTFKYYNMWLSLAGAILCVSVMFLISWWTALITLCVVLALYLVVSYRKPDVNWGSTTQAQTYNNALTAVQQLDRVEEHVKNYRPQLLVLTGAPNTRSSLVDFAHHITKHQSLFICGHIIETPISYKTRNSMVQNYSSWLRASKIKAFYSLVDSSNFQEGATSLLQAAGLGKMRPNILLMGYKQDWTTCSRENLNMYFNIMHKALDMHVAVALLRLQEGLDCSATIGDAEDQKRLAPTSIPGNQSFSQLSQASSTSDISIPGSPTPRRSKTINEYPNPSEEQRENRPNIVPITNILNVVTKFQRKHKKGTIDVWWLYDDGGLTLLLPYIISTRRNWSNCKLRVFALANKNSELEYEQRSMASLLSKFRIDYSALKVIPDISKPAQTGTKTFFDSLIADFQESADSKDSDDDIIKDSELMAMKEKTNRHLRLRELLLENSMEANLVVMTLPMPRKGAVSAPLYMAWLETLTRDMPPFLLVRGNHTSVLTFYS